jgi:hypothetical protein
MQYIADHGKDYRLVVWANAFSVWHLADTFMRLAPRLGLGHITHEQPTAARHLTSNKNRYIQVQPIWVGIFLS